MLRLVCLFLLAAQLGCQAAPSTNFFDDIEDQIVGGHDTDISNYPYQVSFRMYGEHICGGSIINEYWVLTAAHCVKAVSSARVVSIHVGSTSVNGGGKVYKAASIAAHPKYNDGTTQNDVGLVRLSSPIKFSKNAKAIPIASIGKDPAEGETLTVSGWGYLQSDAQEIPDTLQVVDIPVVPRSTCTRKYRQYGYLVDSTMFCAGTTGKDSCQGDSGGPLANAKGVQVGIVSWGIGCASPGLPGVYTNLANSVIRTWIKTVTGL